MKTLITLSILLVLSITTNATTCTSLGNGLWENPATWSCGVVPSAGDTIIIAATDTVTLNTTNVYAGSPMVIIVDGYFLFNSPGAKLHLPCGSKIIVNATGTIASSGVGTPSHNIKICDQLVWEGPDGDVTGPIILSDPIPLASYFLSAEANYDLNRELNIQWTVEGENNCSHYEIDFTEDGTTWLPLITKDAKNLTGAVSYTIKEKLAFISQDIIIKITVVDNDGKKQELTRISVQNTGSDVKIFPNPITPGNPLNIVLNQFSDELAVIQIHSLDGKLMMSQEIDLKKMPQTVQLTTGDLETGVFILSVVGLNERFSKRIVIR